jgi:hypothetical protein
VWQKAEKNITIGNLAVMTDGLNDIPFLLSSIICHVSSLPDPNATSIFSVNL